MIIVEKKLACQHYKVTKNVYEDMIDHSSHTHNLSGY